MEISFMTIKDIAKLAGVSPSTVSKIMNQKDDDIRPETRERVLKIVKDYNYTPYASVTASNQSTFTLGVLLNTAPQSSLLEGIVHAAQENGYSTMIYYSYGNMEQELKNISSLCSHHVDGIIWEPASDTSLSSMAVHLKASGIPFLTTGSFGGEASVSFPYAEYGGFMTRLFLEQGHTKIGCLVDNSASAAAFLSGCRECLFETQHLLDEDLIFSDINESLLYRINSRQLSGLLVFRYSQCLELYHAISALHYRIPEDLSFVTLQEVSEASLSYPGISACSFSLSSFGEYLCHRLIASLTKTDGPGGYIPDFSLNHTESLCPPYNSQIPRIVVVGSINMDTYLWVEHLPRTGKTVSTSKSSRHPGGKALNQAIGVTKLGHPVSLIGNVGSDLDADIIYRELAEHGIDTGGVKRCACLHTGNAYIIVEQSGESMISILAGANGCFTPSDVHGREDLFEQAGYCLIQSEVPMDTVEEACRLAHVHHAKTIFKPSACSHLSTGLLQYIDILIPNENELDELCPLKQTSMEEQAAYLCGLGIETVIVTLGEKGCYVQSGPLKKYFPAAEFTTVDNTGASDAFISALASYLLYGYSLEQSVKIATYSAGFCISRDGVVPALVEKNSLESYINQVDPSLLLHPVVL